MSAPSLFDVWRCRGCGMVWSYQPLSETHMRSVTLYKGYGPDNSQSDLCGPIEHGRWVSDAKVVEIEQRIGAAT